MPRKLLTTEKYYVDDTKEFAVRKKRFGNAIAALAGSGMVADPLGMPSWLNDKIDLLERYSAEPLATPWSSDVRRLAKNYQVTIREGKKILTVSKEKNKTNHLLKVLTRDEYFDAIWEAHFNIGYCHRESIVTYLRDIMEVYIPNDAVNNFFLSCYFCNGQLQIKTKKVKFERGYLELLDMCSTPDGEFQYLMHYRDIHTRFTFLRPLKSPEFKEVALELLKIFLDVGYPSVLHAPTGHVFTKAIISELRKESPDIYILSGVRMNLDKQCDVLKEIREWMRINNSSEWSMGAYHVQFHLNNTKIEGLNYTPFFSILGNHPGKTFGGLPPTVKYITHEEELNNVLDKIEKKTLDKSLDTPRTSDFEEFLRQQQNALNFPGTSGVTLKTTHLSDDNKTSECSLTVQNTNRTSVKTYVRNPKKNVKKSNEVKGNEVELKKIKATEETVQLKLESEPKTEEKSVETKQKSSATSNNSKVSGDKGIKKASKLTSSKAAASNTKISKSLQTKTATTKKNQTASKIKYTKKAQTEEPILEEPKLTRRKRGKASEPQQYFYYHHKKIKVMKQWDSEDINLPNYPNVVSNCVTNDELFNSDEFDFGNIRVDLEPSDAVMPTIVKVESLTYV